MTLDPIKFRELVEAWERCYNYDADGNKMWDDPSAEQVAKAHDSLTIFLLSHASELLALVEASVWRPIDQYTPKDESDILVRFGGGVTSARWTRGFLSRSAAHSSWGWFHTHGTALSTPPTHWKPIDLPPPPEPAQ